MEGIDKLHAVQIRKPVPVRRQLTDSVRELIHSGQLKVGARLPSSQELARRWETDPMTVHRALTPLVREGLLERNPGIGTFVREREAKLTCVGIYDVAGASGSLYVQALHKALKEELTEAGVEMDVWLDPRPDERFAEPWLPFVQAATNREFQALIVAAAHMPQVQWLAKLPVPSAFLSTVDIMPNRVCMDLHQLAQISLQALAQQGCRSVGLIAPNSTEFTGPQGARSIWTDFFVQFTDVARELGLTLRNEWMRLSPHWDSMAGRSFEQFGHEEFLKLWRQPDRPEGLLVNDDVTARGVILAVREQHVRVPEDLKLVLYKNESIDLYCPLPATLAVTSEREVARAVIAQVQKQFRGETCEPINLPFRLMEHSGRSR